MQQNFSGCFSIKNIRNILTDRKSTSNFKNFTKLLAYSKTNRRNNQKIIKKQYQNQCGSFSVKKNSKLFQLPQSFKPNNQYNQPQFTSKSKHFTLQKLNNLSQKQLTASEQLCLKKQSVYKKKQKYQSFFIEEQNYSKQRQRQRQMYNKQRSPQKINLKFNPQQIYYRQAKKRNRYYMPQHLKQKKYNSTFKRQYKNYTKQNALQKMHHRIDTEIQSSRQMQGNNLNTSIISPTYPNQKQIFSHKNISIIQTVYFSHSPLIIKKKQQTSPDQSSLFKNAVSIHQIRKISKKMFLNQLQMKKQVNLKTQQIEKLQTSFRSKTRTNTQFNKFSKHQQKKNEKNLNPNVFLQTQSQEIICGW